MTAPLVNVCSPWIDAADIDCEGATEEQLEDYVMAASNILFRLTGRQFPGSCLDEVRPCAQYRGEDGYGYMRYWPRGWNWHGSWGYCACNVSDRCGCTRLSQVELGAQPVTEINEVKVDGAVLASSAYRIDDFKYLVRIDDEGWPCCQKLELDDTEEDTFSVRFTYGIMPDETGVLAASMLACELYKAFNPEAGPCRLPKRVQSITRQGVTMAIIDPQDVLDEGRTGIAEIDLFIKAYNPGGISRRATVWSPDTEKKVRRVGT